MYILILRYIKHTPGLAVSSLLRHMLVSRDRHPKWNKLSKHQSLGFA